MAYGIHSATFRAVPPIGGKGLSQSDTRECVAAGTRKVIEMGYADPRRIGVTGHPSTLLGMALSRVSVRQSSPRP